MLDLKERRLSLNLTLEQVGNFVGVGKSTVRKWENGLINNIGSDKIQKYAKTQHIVRFILFLNFTTYQLTFNVETIYNERNR